MQHLYEELLDAAVYLKKIQHGPQGFTNNQKENYGTAQGITPSESVSYSGATMREVPEGEPNGSGDGLIEVESEDEDTESEDRLLTCSTEIEAAVNALSMVEGKDKMLLSGQEKKMVNEIEAMSLYITYRALAEIYQSVFWEQLNPSE